MKATKGIKSVKRIYTQAQIDVIKTNTVAESARILGLSKNAIYCFCRNESISPVWQRKSASLQNWGTEYREINDLWNTGDVTIHTLCEKYDLRPSDVCQKVGIRSPTGAAIYLTKREVAWLEYSCPNGMGINEYIASFVRDAYMEEKE